MGKEIHTGWEGKAGHLKGSNRAETVDFRNQRGVYVLYDDHKTAIYVGQAGKGKASLFNRLKQHTNDHLWNRWEYFSWFGLCKVNKKGELIEAEDSSAKVKGTISDSLNEIEGVLILSVEPQLNKKGPTWKGVKEYFQDTEDEEETTIYDLYEKQEKLEEKISKILHILES